VRKRRHNIIEFDFYISPDGEQYNFNDEVDHFLFSFEGEGMPPIDYRTQRGPFQHGETLVDYFLRPRVIQLVHRRQDCNRQGYWDARRDLIDFVRPNRQTGGLLEPGILRKTFPDGTRLDINAIIQEGPRFRPRQLNEWDEFGFTEVLRFICHDPTFFDPDQDSLTFSLPTYSHLVFPVTLVPGDDMVFGISTIEESDTISYTGTWLTYPTIVLTGPMENPVVENITTDEKLELEYNIDEGEVVTITLEYGNKAVTNGGGTDLVGTLSTDSDLGTFHIAPDPEAPDGNNQIDVSFGGANENSQIVISYYTRFIGI
jgi:hypothetical protein